MSYSISPTLYSGFNFDSVLNFHYLDQVPLLARISRKPAQPSNRTSSSRQRAPRAPLVWPLPFWSPCLWWLQSSVVLPAWPTVKSKLGKDSSLFNRIQQSPLNIHPQVARGCSKETGGNWWVLNSFDFKGFLVSLFIIFVCVIIYYGSQFYSSYRCRLHTVSLRHLCIPHYFFVFQILSPGNYQIC